MRRCTAWSCRHFDDLVISTYGRGIWILDDLSPLQQLTPQIQASRAHLFPIRPAYRFTDIAGNYATNDDPTAARKTQDRAGIKYWPATPAPGPLALTARRPGR